MGHKSIENTVTNVSDHYPISIAIKCNFARSKSDSTNSCRTSTRVNWEKINKDDYKQLVSTSLNDNHFNSSNFNTTSDVTTAIERITGIMFDASMALTKKKTNARASKPKLKVWNSDISNTLKNLRTAHANWAKAGKIVDQNDKIYTVKKQCKTEFRKQCRIAVARNLAAERDEIMSTRTRDTKLFYKLINRQRATGRNMIDDLYVGDSCFTGQEGILDGFKVHFENLAKESNNDVFDSEYHVMIENEV